MPDEKAVRPQNSLREWRIRPSKAEESGVRAADSLTVHREDVQVLRFERGSAQPQASGLSIAPRVQVEESRQGGKSIEVWREENSHRESSKGGREQLLRQEKPLLLINPVVKRE